MFPCLLAKSDGNEPVIIAFCNRIFVLNQAMANSLHRQGTIRSLQLSMAGPYTSWAG